MDQKNRPKRRDVIWIGESAAQFYQNTNKSNIENFDHYVLRYTRSELKTNYVVLDDVDTIYLDEVMLLTEQGYNKKDLSIAINTCLNEIDLNPYRPVIIGSLSEIIVQASVFAVITAEFDLKNAYNGTFVFLPVGPISKFTDIKLEISEAYSLARKSNYRSKKMGPGATSSGIEMFLNDTNAIQKVDLKLPKNHPFNIRPTQVSTQLINRKPNTKD